MLIAEKNPSNAIEQTASEIIKSLHKLTDVNLPLSRDERRQLNRSVQKFVKKNFEFVGDVRGYGIMKGVEIVENKENKTASKELATKIISNSRKNGLLLVNCGKEGNVIRFMGPLTTPLNQVREAMEMFNSALEKI